MGRRNRVTAAAREQAEREQKRKAIVPECLVAEK